MSKSGLTVNFLGRKLVNVDFRAREDEFRSEVLGFMAELLHITRPSRFVVEVVSLAVGKWIRVPLGTLD